MVKAAKQFAAKKPIQHLSLSGGACMGFFFEVLCLPFGRRPEILTEGTGTLRERVYYLALANSFPYKLLL